MTPAWLVARKQARRIPAAKDKRRAIRALLGKLVSLTRVETLPSGGRRATGQLFDRYTRVRFVSVDHFLRILRQGDGECEVVLVAAGVAKPCVACLDATGRTVRVYDGRTAMMVACTALEALAASFIGEAIRAGSLHYYGPQLHS